jgi:hexosaminidase
LHYYDGNWQGYHGVDFEGVVDLGEEMNLDSVSISMLQDTGSWIFLPTGTGLSVSPDGVNYVTGSESAYVDTMQRQEPFIRTYSWKTGLDGAAGNGAHKGIRYIRIFAKNIGRCPKGHPGAGDKAWLFVDEVVIVGERVTK